MPTSSLLQLNEIMFLIMHINPKSILDIGVGFGKYGFLSREYLEIWASKRNYKDWERQIDGIEIFEGYLTPIHNFIYNHLYIGNAINVLPTIKTKYDLILLIDIIEHVKYEEGMQLLEECKKHSRNILISTPKYIGIQKDAFNNPYEIHRFQWEKKHFINFKEKFFVPNTDSLIILIGEDTLRIKRSCRNFLIKLETLQIFSYFSRLFRVIKRFF